MLNKLLLTPVFSLSMLVSLDLSGCDRQVPPPKSSQEIPPADIPVVSNGRRALDKAKGVETTLGEAGNRTAETSKEA